MTMATVLYLQLLVTLFVAFAPYGEALKCYKSDKTKEECTAQQRYCKTMTTERAAGTMMVKHVETGCKSACNSGRDTKCCNSNLCNSDHLKENLCYMCSSITGGCDKHGVDPSNDAVMMTPCAGSCVKTLIEASGQTIVARACVLGKCEEGDLQSNAGRAITACCKGNKCNGGAKLPVTFSLILVATVASFIFMRF